MPLPGLVKVAPIPIVPAAETPVAAPPVAQAAITAPSWEGVPIDLIRYLGKDIGTINSKDIEQLKDIDSWTKKGLLEDSIGNRLAKLKGLEQQLGEPGLHETKMNKIWNWVKMSFQIDEIRNRQRAFER